MRKSTRIVIGIVALLFSGAHPQGDAVLPANFDLPGDLSAIVTHVYAQSPAFRAQCDRLATIQHLHVTVRLDANMRRSCRAFTVITHRRDMMRADVHVPPGQQLPELIAHEFEHILEQVDHVDLRGLAGVRGSGVHQVESDLFETERAQRMGRMVAAEVRDRRERRPFATD
jgi:hypothetical protein